MAGTRQPDALEQAINEMTRQAVRERGDYDAGEPLGPSLSHVSYTSLHAST
jgi:hypothetical protein